MWTPIILNRTLVTLLLLSRKSQFYQQKSVMDPNHDTYRGMADQNHSDVVEWLWLCKLCPLWDSVAHWKHQQGPNARLQCQGHSNKRLLPSHDTKVAGRNRTGVIWRQLDLINKFMDGGCWWSTNNNWANVLIPLSGSVTWFVCSLLAEWPRRLDEAENTITW